MSAHFNKLTPAEAERLAMLAEEAGEVVQIVGKILRHGFESHHPDGGRSNRELLEREVGDFFGVARFMEASGDIAGGGLLLFSTQKMHRAKPYLHHQVVEDDRAY